MNIRILVLLSLVFASSVALGCGSENCPGHDKPEKNVVSKD